MHAVAFSWLDKCTCLTTYRFQIRIYIYLQVKVSVIGYNIIFFDTKERESESVKNIIML